MIHHDHTYAVFSQLIGRFASGHAGTDNQSQVFAVMMLCHVNKFCAKIRKMIFIIFLIRKYQKTFWHDIWFYHREIIIFENN